MNHSRVDDDQFRTIVHCPEYVSGNNWVLLGSIAPDDKDDICIFDIGDGISHCPTAECPDQPDNG